MMHTEFDSHWLGSNGNYESSHNLTNYANMRRLSQNNNNPKVVQEDIQGFTRYGQFPRPANIYSTPTINTANSHCDTINPLYSAQGPHQIPQQWQAYYQNSNSFGSSFTGEVPQQEPVQIQNTQVPYFKPTQSWSNNQNVMQYRNQNVNYSQFYVSNDNHKTSNCSNKTQVNDNYVLKTPRIRVRDVHSVNNTVCHGVHSTLHEPQRKEQTNNYANYLSSQRRVENSVMQTPYVNFDVSGYKSMSNKGNEFYEVLPDNQLIPVSVNNLDEQNIMKRLAWVPKLNLPNSRSKNEVLNSGVPGQRKTNINVKKPVCPHYAENALMGSKRIKISPRRVQSGEGSFFELQSNQMKSGFKKPVPNFSLSSACGLSNNAIYSISNMQTSRQNFVQRSQPMEIIRSGCNLSILTPCIVSSTINTNSQYVSTMSLAKSKSTIGSLNENSVTTNARPQTSSELSDTYIPSGAFYRMPNANNNTPDDGRISRVPGLIMTKKNENTKARVLPECSKSKSQERNDFSDNLQGGNQLLSVDEIIKESFCNREPLIMKDLIKTEAEETSNSGQQFLKSSASKNNPMNVEDFLALVKSEPLTEPVCAPESYSKDDNVTLDEKENIKGRTENSTREKLSSVGSNYENNIDREKLDRLIEFLEGNVIKEKNDIPTEVVESGKRKGEVDSSSHSRRKLKKSSIVKNKNQTREMISLVCCKPFRKELKCTTNTISVSGSMCRENLDEEIIPKNKKNEKFKEETDESLVVKEFESEMRDRKKLSPRRSSTKENVEEKKKARKPKGNGERLPIMLESDIGVDISKDIEEADIINTLRAFQNLQYHYCMSCDLNSSNDSFWINVVSGELRCLNCFKKMTQRTRKTALKSKNVLENSLHEPKLPENSHEEEIQEKEKKKEEKNESSDKIEINSNDKEITTSISTKEIKQILENVDQEDNSKEKIRRKEKNDTNESDKLAGQQFSPSGDPKRRKKKTRRYLENWNPSLNWNTSSNLTEPLNKDETKTKKEKKDGIEREINQSGHEKECNQKYQESWNLWKSSPSLKENETKSKKEKNIFSEKKSDRSDFEKETVFVQKLTKQMKNRLKNKKKIKSAKVSVEGTLQNKNPELACTEKYGKAKTNLERKKKCLGCHKSEGTVRKEKNEAPKVSKGQNDLMEKVYEKTKKVSWTLLGES